MAIGTLYKDMKLKPTVLKEYTENRTMAAQLGATAFMQADDGLILEDESARIRLTGRLEVGQLVTGVVLAVRGVYDAHAGIMDVREFTYAGARGGAVCTFAACRPLAADATNSRGVLGGARPPSP